MTALPRERASARLSRARRWACCLPALLLGGCASVDGQWAEQRSDSVDQRLLAPAASVAGAAQVEQYRMQAGQAFRMPLLHDNADPALPADTPRRSLPPTVICVRVIIDASGAVQRSEPLLDRAECQAGADPANADLLQAVSDAVRGWQYIPAAVCHYPGPPPARVGDCAGAERIEEVAVTLNYAFTFQMERGQVQVQRGGVGGR